MMGYLVGAGVVVLMGLIYAEFRVKEDRIRQGEALDRGESINKE